MEWMLQVVDEVDDAVAALRHSWLGRDWARLLSASAAGLAAVGACLALGAGSVGGMTLVVLSACATLKVRELRRTSPR